VGGDAHTLRAERDTARLELERLRVISDTAIAKLTHMQRLQAPPQYQVGTPHTTTIVRKGYKALPAQMYPELK
jgi:hypothetical protein